MYTCFRSSFAAAAVVLATAGVVVALAPVQGSPVTAAPVSTRYMLMNLASTSTNHDEESVPRRVCEQCDGLLDSYVSPEVKLGDVTLHEGVLLTTGVEFGDVTLPESVFLGPEVLLGGAQIDPKVPDGYSATIGSQTLIGPQTLIGHRPGIDPEVSIGDGLIGRGSKFGAMEGLSSDASGCRGCRRPGRAAKPVATSHR